MRTTLFALVFAIGALPVAAVAQGFPGLSPEMQAQVQQIRTNATTASYAAMSADHRGKVQAIITQFNSGALTIPDAAKQIDAILTPQEAQAVLDQRQKMRDAMLKAYEAANGGATPPPMRRRDETPPTGQASPRPAPDAGRIFLQIAASQDAYRAALQP